MKGEAKLLLKFLDGSDNRYIIPVYQRNYDWTQKQCKQLFDDLEQVARDGRKSHFFGSIVATLAEGGGGSDFLIIDGQQRITTVSILLVAIINLLKTGRVKSDDEKLVRYIENKYIVDEYSPDERKLRLKPIKADCIAFDKIVAGNEDEFDRSSNVTQNYEYFCSRILSATDLTIAELFDSIKKLEIIDIFVERDENPQLIFESLNSTGLDLTEADKIRNFILMGLDSKIQEEYYEKYWNKIEKATDFKVSDFIRHFLTLKQKKIPNMNAVYFTFKNYVQDGKITPENYGDLLGEMLSYAKIYSRISGENTGDWPVSKNILSSILRLKILDVSVSYPFLLALFSGFENGEISESEVEKSLLCVESFVFRRLICPGFPTNSLNKIFCTLDSDIKRLNKSNSPYSSVLVYILESKKNSAAFPTNIEFKRAIREQNVYKMQKKSKIYLFDMLENERNPVEHVNVVGLMESDDETNRLTVEHIMPQTLSEEWKRDLGENWKEIFETRLHTLPNLTLTGYNSQYSNERFITKKTMKHGFLDSGLNINKIFQNFDKWTNDEINSRCDALVADALRIWPYPETDFVPLEADVDEVTLEEADDLSGRKLAAYSCFGEERISVKNWADMYTSVVRRLLLDDYSPLQSLAASKQMAEIRYSADGNLYSPNGRDSAWFELGQGLYLYKANSTSAKLNVLERIFEAYGKDKEELVFYLKNEKTDDKLFTVD